MAKIIRFREFVSEIQSLLGHCELRSDNPLGDPNVWRSTLGMGDSDYFVMKKTASYNYFRGLDYIREKLEVNDVEVSEDYLNNSYYRFIVSQKRNNGDLSGTCQTWIDGLNALKLKQFKLLIPINHYDYRDEIDLGVIKVVELTDEILQQNFNINGQIDEILNAGKLSEFNDTRTFAIVDVESLEEEHAKEFGYQLVERFIYATKLIDPGSYIRLRKWAMVQVNENILVEEKGKPPSDSMHSHHLPVRINPGKEFYNNLQPYWDKLAGFLYSKNRTDLQDVIISALYWFGESDVHTDSRVKLFLNYVTGLEWIILHKSDDIRQKAVPFGKRCAKIFSGDEKYWEFWKDYYWKRNDITHKEFVYIYKEEIDTLRIDLRSLLLQLVDFTGKYDNLKDMFDKEYAIK